MRRPLGNRAKSYQFRKPTLNMLMRLVIAGESVYEYETTIDQILEAKRKKSIIALQRYVGGEKERIVYVDASFIAIFYENNQ